MAELSPFDPSTFAGRVGRYWVGPVIGEGATGRVMVGWEPDLGVRVAVKQLSARLLQTPGFVDRFRGEATILARLAHPNVVGVRDYIEDANGAWLVMELLDGPTLRAVIASAGRLTPEQALGALDGALAGLGHAHTSGVLHRDLKPDNVLVNRAGVSKLADFGLAAPAGASSGTPTGTPAYASPEAVRGEPVDARSDLYSAGVVLFELLEGRLPFVAPDPASMMAMHLNASPPRLVHGPSTLVELCASALAKDPAARPDSAAEFTERLERGATEGWGADWVSRASLAGVAGLLGGAATAAGVVGAGGGAAAAGTVLGGTEVAEAALAAPPPPPGPAGGAVSPGPLGPPGTGAGTVPQPASALPRRLRPRLLVAAAAAVVVAVVAVVVAVALPSGGHKTTTVSGHSAPATPVLAAGAVVTGQATDTGAFTISGGCTGASTARNVITIAPTVVAIDPKTGQLVAPKLAGTIHSYVPPFPVNCPTPGAVSGTDQGANDLGTVTLGLTIGKQLTMRVVQGGNFPGPPPAAAYGWDWYVGTEGAWTGPGLPSKAEYCQSRSPIATSPTSRSKGTNATCFARGDEHEVITVPYKETPNKDCYGQAGSALPPIAVTCQPYTGTLTLTVRAYSAAEAAKILATTTTTTTSSSSTASSAPPS